MPPHKRKPQNGILVMLALAGAALLSGCAGLADTDDVNRAPRAALDADKTQGWTGDDFTFDAQASSDPDGNVTSWRFDFGDGTRYTASDEDAARVKHAYAAGGEYVVTVQVVDDGTQDGLEEKADEASVRVAVDERVAVAAQVVKTQPLNTSSSRQSIAFDGNVGADLARINVSVQSLLPAGGSEVRLRLLDPTGAVLAERTTSLPDGQAKDVAFDAPLDDRGEHTLEVVAESGSIRVTGDLEVLYSEDVDSAESQA
ncbi:MAG: PKD domain-containing protein [Candidatus Thermoplasmatota archaeon]